MKFKKLNNIIGWSVFVFSALLYLLSMERAFSFWDCGEYIVSSAKLGVTHAPGAAVFQLIGAVWAGLAMGDGNLYSILINSLSAISSAFTILFLFWTITHLARKIFLIGEKEELTGTETLLVMATGVLGAISFAFSDSFWFSAVEGEVYAMASMVTALMLWLACKWENQAGTDRENKWLILISLIIGLSVGIHLMAILVVPAICYIYYFKHYDFTWKNFAIANAVIIAIFYFVFKVVFSYTMSFFGNLEIFLVNNFGMPFQSGLVVGLLIYIVLFTIGLRYTYRKKWVEANTAILAVLFMIIGFSSWLVIPIRANANPHMNLNDPDDAIGLLSYFNREQYPDWPVFYGPLYTATLDPNGVERNPDGSYKLRNKGPIYKKNSRKGTYEIIGQKYDYTYTKEHIGLFARMHNPQVAENYKAMMGDPKEYKEYDIETHKEITHLEKPTLWQNIEFFLNYQVGYMYLRYLGWNFVGRQNDIEGNLEITKGNVITGIPFIDNFFFGDQSKLPDKFKDNKARNVYFGIPLILGIIGFIFQWKRDPKRTFALVSLFLLTGLGIIIYTNNKPFEPRERDYAIVTSFYVFAIWIGFGVLAIFEFLKSKISIKPALALSAVAFACPILMGTQNWDDHDRSERLAAHDLAYNYLVNLDPNSILFVYGDNDTYPLWALQETEMFRPDVKIENYTLLGSQWNIVQAHRKTYDALAVPHQLTEDDYRQSENENILLIEFDFISRLKEIASDNQEVLSLLEKLEPYAKNGMTAKEAVKWILSRDNTTKNDFIALLKRVYNPNIENILPTNKIIVPVNRQNVIKHKLVSEKYYSKILPNLKIELKGGSIGARNELFMLDLFANYNWDRPIYFSSGGMYDDANIFYTNDYLQFEGFTYKLVPLENIEKNYGKDAIVDGDRMYKQIKNYRWANFDNPEAYFDQTSKNNILTYRNAVIKTAETLAKEGKQAKAKEIIELLMQKIPMKRFSAGFSLYGLIPVYRMIGEEQKAKELQDFLMKRNQEEVDFYESLSPIQQSTIVSDWERLKNEQQYFTGLLVQEYMVKGDTVEAKKVFEKVYNPLVKRLKEAFNKAGSIGLNNLTKSEENDLTNLLSSQRNMLSIASEIDSLYLEQKYREMESFLGKFGIGK